MKLTDVLRCECIQAGSAVDDKAMALCEIASLAKKSKLLKSVSEETVLEALQERETLGSTAFGRGIAIPHCRLQGIKDFVVGVLTSPQGVEFESEDGQKVHLIVFIIAPREQSDRHIRLLSMISRMLQDDSMVEKLIEAKSAAEVKAVLLESAEDDLSEQLPVVRSQIHIFVQNDKIFRSILEKLAGLDDILLTVVEAKPTRSYLSKTSLYADFSKNGKTACKVIVAVVERSLSNEVIRRVETITGPLLECTGVMVTVQELSYFAGSLEM